MKRSRKLLVAFILFSIVSLPDKTYAQFCQGFLGKPVWTVTFGSNQRNPAPYIDTPTAAYGNALLGESIEIYNKTEGWFGWFAVDQDHTPDDVNGYMLLFSHEFEAGVPFYEATVSGLCENTTYELAAWILNLYSNSSYALPNITLHVETVGGGKALQTFKSGDIHSGATQKWQQLGTLFTTPAGTTSVTVKIWSNNPDFAGNDFLLDDLTIRPCGSFIKASISGHTDSITVCVGDQNTFTLTAAIPGSYVNPQYQWQLSTDGGANWADIPGANSLSYVRPAIPSPGIYLYRLMVSANNNMACGTFSNVLSITVSTNAQTCCIRDTTLNITVCKNESYLGYDKTGKYVDILPATDPGCDSVRTLNLTVLPELDTMFTVSICEWEYYFNYNTTGIYTDHFRSFNNCDSMRIVDLTVKPTMVSFPVKEICLGEFYLGHNTSGTYIDTVITTSTCEIRSLTLTVKPAPSLTLTATICEGESFLGYNTTGSHVNVYPRVGACDSTRTLELFVKPNVSIEINEEICAGENYYGHNATGTYVDHFTAANGCDSARTVHLTVGTPPEPRLGPDQELCKGNSIVLTPGSSFDSYLWQDGSMQPQLTVTQPGFYTVIVKNACGEASDEVNVIERDCVLAFPNAFTPNRDGRNDLFKILNGYDFQEYQLVIYNRWGQKLFETKDPSKGWDGNYKSKPADTGVYMWQCTYKKSDIIKIMKGVVVLTR